MNYSLRGFRPGAMPYEYVSDLPTMRVPVWTPEPVADEAVCKGCGETFVRRGPDDTREYCSYLCRPGAVMPEGEKEAACCGTCGVTFWREVRHHGGHPTVYCSKLCRNKAIYQRRKARGTA